MHRIERIAAAGLAAGIVWTWTAGLLLTGSQTTPANAGSLELSAKLPVQVILIVQDAKALQAEHARMGQR